MDIYLIFDCICSQAPKVTTIPAFPPQINASFGYPTQTNILQPVPYIEPQGTTDGLFFFARRSRADKKEIPGYSEYHWNDY